MRVIKRQTLLRCWTKHNQAETPLRAWYAEVRAAKWNGPADVKKAYGSADILPNNRVVFNIGGNNLRLVAKVMYTPGLVYIRFVGTHSEYDKIDAETI